MKKLSTNPGTKRAVSGRTTPRKQPRKNTGGAPVDGATPVDAKWREHYRVLVELRNLLLMAKRERLHEAAEPLEPHSMDLADSATDEFDHDLCLCKLSTQQDELGEIEEAIRRILDGTYGTCEATGKPIAARRLRAIPWTRYSRQAEAELEKKGVLQRPRIGAIGSIRWGEPEIPEKIAAPIQDEEEALPDRAGAEP